MSFLFFSSKSFFLGTMGLDYIIPALYITIASEVLSKVLLKGKMQLHFSLLGDSGEEKGK